MTKIVYGVSGEGSGHSSRSREMAKHLVDQGHDLWLVSYDRGYQNLKDDFRVFETEGLAIASSDNRVSVVETFTKNLKRLPKGHRKLHDLRKKLFKEFDPDCVITDFEPMTAYLAHHYDVPLITVDNQHRMRYMEYECPPGLKAENKITRTIIRAMVPRPDVSLVITFLFSPTTNQRTFLFPPILRDSVLKTRPTRGEHLLVYLTSGFESLLRRLKSFTRERFVIYGYDQDRTEGPCQYKPFSRDGFLADLASAKAVIATAGFTLISEAMYLKKPYCAFPMNGQFEQQLNATMLAEVGCGKNAAALSDDTVGDFLYRLPEYESELARRPEQDNDAIKQKLDELVADGAALARKYHEQRTTKTT